MLLLFMATQPQAQTHHSDIEKTRETERQLREKLRELEDLRLVLEQNELEANEARRVAQEAAECAIAERLLKVHVTFNWVFGSLLFFFVKTIFNFSCFI